MAAGELVSVRAHDELVRHEINVEQQELADDPVGEQRELAAMYRARGVPAADADTVARILMATPEVALDTHARLELGVDPDDRGSSVQAAVVSFLSFSVGALLPLLPWFFTGGTTAVLGSIIIGSRSRYGPSGQPSAHSRPRGVLANGWSTTTGGSGCSFGHLRSGPSARSRSARQLAGVASVAEPVVNGLREMVNGGSQFVRICDDDQL